MFSGELGGRVTLVFKKMTFIRQTNERPESWQWFRAGFRATIGKATMRTTVAQGH